ncbi:MAG: hypothetical protein V4477_13470 [Pseudomonadota bacterium]
MSLTIKRLIDFYRTDTYLSYLRLKYPVRLKHDRLLARIEREHGSSSLRSIRTRTLLVWHSEWQAGGKTAMAHSLMACLRLIFRFGAGMLEDRDCFRLHDAMVEMRIEGPSRRTLEMTKDQAEAVRAKAHEFGWHSIALAQALQYELLLSQKDVIGEWVPILETGESDVVFRGQKWLRGLRWSHIGKDLSLKFATGKSRRPISVDLLTARMVMEEFAFLGSRKNEGPIIICEITGAPYATSEFRRKWRIVADAAGISKDIRSSDSKPNGLIIGGPNRATISRNYSWKDICSGPRMLGN